MKLHTITARPGRCTEPFFTRVRLRHDHAETGGGWSTALRGMGCRDERADERREACASSAMTCRAD